MNEPESGCLGGTDVAEFEGGSPHARLGTVVGLVETRQDLDEGGFP
jgi:hypothetical protein